MTAIEKLARKLRYEVHSYRDDEDWTAWKDLPPEERDWWVAMAQEMLYRVNQEAKS